jgi:hypothetical protein
VATPWLYGLGEPTGTVFEGGSVYDRDVGVYPTKGDDIRIVNMYDISVLSKGIALSHVSPVQLRK